MKVSDFQFDLPEDQIAQYPLAERSASRLLQLERRSGRWHDRRFAELPELLAPEDLLVFNNTRVIPARLCARKESGGRVEIMIERVVSDREAIVQLRANRKPVIDSRWFIDGQAELCVCGREEAFWRLSIASGPGWSALLEAVGHMPLPPHIERSDAALDAERYQTVFAKVPGAVAAPTAGLHFDASVFAGLDALGVHRAECTLHVGAGTFQPVRVERISEHRMHAEWLSVSDSLVAAVEAARARGGRVIAV